MLVVAMIMTHDTGRGGYVRKNLACYRRGLGEEVSVPFHLLISTLTARFEGKPDRGMMSAKAHRHTTDGFRHILRPSRFNGHASPPKSS